MSQTKSALSNRGSNPEDERKEEYDEGESEHTPSPTEELMRRSEEVLPAVRNAKKKLDINTATREEITAKCEHLNEILDYLDECKKLGLCPPNSIFGEIVEMAAHNLFRQLPEKLMSKCPDAIEEEIEAVEPFWDHLKMVYTILHRTILLEGNEYSLRMYVSERFLQNLVELFDSHDLREREKLKVVVHRAYWKMYVWRPLLRKKMGEILIRHVHADATRGINQLLQVYGCIVSGFSLPLREEHIRFLDKILLPLHKAQDIGEYHTFLTYCLVQFLYLDETLTEPIISGILKYWPTTDSTKEVLFLKEIEHLFQVILPEQFDLVAEKLFKQITKCMISPNAQVGDAAFMLWKNQRALTMIAMFHEKIMPVVFPSMYSMRRQHWSPKITAHLYSLFKSLLVMNRGLFQELVALCRSHMEKDPEKKVRFSATLSVKEIELNSEITSETFTKEMNNN